MENIVGKIKKYLERLDKGERLEAVRADFVRELGSVDASEIMAAEEELLKAGTPLNKVQRLCDVHAALFKGKISKEERMKTSEALAGIEGHPLNTFMKENLKLRELIEECKKAPEKIQSVREIAIHYAKKGDLIYPLLDVKYNISGPSAVMWTTDVDIRNGINRLCKAEKKDENWKEDVGKLLTMLDDMIYKEENILFPNCAVNFSEEDWQNIYMDSKDYDVCFGVENATWDGVKKAKEKVAIEGDIIKINGGMLSLNQLEAILNTIPLEITFVDEDNINRYFNEGHKVFKRSMTAIGREVFSCHPPKVSTMVRRIIDEFRNGSLDSMPVWMEKAGRTMLVTYIAVRDENDGYIGTLELIQDMEFAKEYFKQN